MEGLLDLDRELFLFFNGLGNNTWDAFWLFMSHKLSALPLYLFLLIASFRAFGTKKTLLLLVAITLLVTVTDQLGNFFKYGVQRLRPCHDPQLEGLVRLVKANCGGKYGYFSAHAGNSMAVAIFFGTLLRSQYRYLGYFLLCWALLVGYSRIYLGVHYPLDILTGFLIGAFMGWLFTKLYIFATKKILHDL
jgi:undecaprenyl-diphosphatase